MPWESWLGLARLDGHITNTVGKMLTSARGKVLIAPRGRTAAKIRKAVTPRGLGIGGNHGRHTALVREDKERSPGVRSMVPCRWSAELIATRILNRGSRLALAAYQIRWGQSVARSDSTTQYLGRPEQWRSRIRG